jgi:hypothetical protein
MANHVANLALRFLLELCALAALGYWGWTQHQGVTRWLLAILAPLVAATLWGVFRVPNDGGAPVVTVPGAVRLGLEAVFFVAAVAALVAADRPRTALLFGGITMMHYMVSYDRVLWLLRGAPA